MKRYHWAIWFILLIWMITALATIDYNGPFFDEGIYVTAGLRTLEGHGRSDGYLTWFAGSLIWPTLAGLGYQAGGLAGIRVLALLLSAGAFLAVVQAAKNLFGVRTAFWTALSLALSGPFFALARLGVYDIPALVGIAVSFWALTELQVQENRAWLVLAAVAFTLSLFSKYPMGLMLLPLAGTLYALRRERALLDLGIFGFISVGLTLAFFLPARETFVELAGWQVANKPTFGVTPLTIAFGLFYYSLVPFLLALVGWYHTRERRLLATVLLASLAIWPAYHLLSGNPVGPNKHVVFGFLFAYPLGGRALQALGDWKGQRPWLSRALLGGVVVGLALWGGSQVLRLEQAWPDLREESAFLLAEVQPGEKLLINESWPYIMYLYGEERITSPWDVTDAYQVTQAEVDLCEYDWFINTQGSYAWPAGVVAEIEACGSFEEVFSSQSPMVGLGRDLNFVYYLVETEISRNIGR
ncbi:MAG: ArnT family glycosyltransferase [Anaerolineales bacterium]